MAWTAEQKRDAHAQRKRDRAAEDERRGVRRKPRGRPPLYHHWDDSAGAWVIDEAGEALKRRQLELPPLPSRPDDLNAWAAANPPPRRDDFATQELFDEAREPWYAMLMGKRLPPYGQNTERAKAWGFACRRHSERLLSHEIAQERAVEKAERDAAALAEMEKAEQDEREQKLKEDAAVAALKARLADCELRGLMRYHEACGQWHHPMVPCEEAHRWPMRTLPEDFLERATGTLHVEGIGPVQGRREPEECRRYLGRCCGTVQPVPGGNWTYPLGGRSRCACIRDQSDEWHDRHHDGYRGFVEGIRSVIPCPGC